MTERSLQITFIIFMSSSYFTYIYFDPRTDEAIYVGKGKPTRIKEHLVNAKNPWLRNKLNVLFKLELNPSIISIPAIDNLTACALERFWIKVFGRKDINTGSLCNFTDGGEGGEGRIWSESSKQKISEANFGRKRTKETCQNISRAKIAKMTDATRRKISNAKLGMSRSKEVKRKCSLALLGRKRGSLSDEIKLRMSAAATERWKRQKQNIIV